MVHLPNQLGEVVGVNGGIGVNQPVIGLLLLLPEIIILHKLIELDREGKSGEDFSLGHMGISTKGEM